MRFGRITLLPVTALSLGVLVPGFAAPDEAAKPVQYQIRLQRFTSNGEIFPKVADAAVSELREKGWVASETAVALRPSLAVALAAGRVSLADQVTVATLEGVGARIDVGTKEQPGLSTSVVPHTVAGKVQLDLRLVYGKPADGQVVQQKITVANGDSAVVRIPGTKQLPGEHLVFLQVLRLTP